MLLKDAISWAITAVEGKPYMGEWTDDEGGPITTRTKVIYGNGGQNRYFVFGNEVVFSAFHSTPEGIAKAKAVGFRVVM
tara:strand:+ start:1699 stop:1935 length:237 start_codon:yes stop_codon:yes gene_type:complete